MKVRKKLIEVAMPLDAINQASAREKSIRHGHPSTLHLWWARRPLAAARAVIFGQMVDDPSSVPEEFPTEEAQDAERQRLFDLIKEMVPWEATNNDEIMGRAREEIWKSWRRACADNADHPQATELFNPKKLPGFHDPFAGGGSLPLEAQRLGLEAYASDLNPVAVLINKAMIEIPPKFAGLPPVNPESRADRRLVDKVWKGAEGLAEDVRYYGKWMRDEAFKRIGHLYPKVEITAEMAMEREDLKPLVGQSLTVIAWIWARTVKSPNPAFAHVDVPLAATFVLASKPGKEAFVEPIVQGDRFEFKVKLGRSSATSESGTKLGRASFRCILSGEPISAEHLRTEGKAGRMSARLMAVVLEGVRGRIYVDPLPAHAMRAEEADKVWQPDSEMPDNPRWFSPPLYGFATYGRLFTNRQLIALTTFSDLVEEARTKVKLDTEPIGPAGQSYADGIATYLALSASKCADNNSTICSWMSGVKYEVVRNTFSRQSLPMSWDYAEPNPFAQSSGDFEQQVGRVSQVFKESLSAFTPGHAAQSDAQTSGLGTTKIVSTVLEATLGGRLMAGIAGRLPDKEKPARRPASIRTVGSLAQGRARMLAVGH